MQNRAWVKDFFTRWKRKARPLGGDRAFYALLSKFEIDSLLIPVLDLDSAKPENEDETLLLDCWRAWNDFNLGNPQKSLGKLKDLARKSKRRPEPYVLLGTAALLRNDRSVAYKALNYALKLYPDNEQIELLLKRLGERKDPVLPFLDRSNKLNIALGKLRHRLFSS